MSISSKSGHALPSTAVLSPESTGVCYPGRFSLRDVIFEAVMLQSGDIEQILVLEQATWIPELQASRDTILDRLSHNHLIMALRRDSEYVGMIGWCYSTFCIEDSAEAFPRNFRAFSSGQSCQPACAGSAFIYNVGVKPLDRKQGIGGLLLQCVFDKIRQDKVKHVFLDSRMPSYNGSYTNGRERIVPNKEFKKAVDAYFVDHCQPVEETLSLDQTVRFYLNNGFEPWFIVRDFIDDLSSGNMRLICHKTL